MFEADEIRAMLEAAGVQLKAMILLGINAAYEPHDLQKLPFAALPDLDGTDDRWLTWPRPKTGIKRKAWMWPETAEALRSYLQSRPHPKEKAADHLVFITKYGQAWGNSMNHFPVSQEFRKLAQEAGVYRPSVGFLGLRHAFETIAGDTGDQVAVDMVMGHDRADMASIYRERVKDERIQKVCDAVRQWILSNSPNGKMWPDVELPCGKG
jgi:integrase